MENTKSVSPMGEKKEVVEVKVVQFGMPNKSWKKLFIWALVVYFSVPALLLLTYAFFMIFVFANLAANL